MEKNVVYLHKFSNDHLYEKILEMIQDFSYTPPLIDYEELIDPLCIPVIKLLREEGKFNTLFCCQGMCKEEKKNPKSGYSHSYAGYISADYTPKLYSIFLKLAKLEKARWPKKCREEDLVLLRKKENRVAFYLPSRIWNSKEELEKEWKIIEKAIRDEIQ